MSNDCFQVSEQWLQETVFLVNDFLFVKQLLHSFIVSLLSVECKSLEFFLILTVVEHSLWKNNIGLDRGIKILELWPSSTLDLHGIKHIPIDHLSLSVLDVTVTHFLEQSGFSLLKGFHFLIGHP